MCDVSVVTVIAANVAVASVVQLLLLLLMLLLLFSLLLMLLLSCSNRALSRNFNLTLISGNQPVKNLHTMRAPTTFLPGESN